MNGIESCVSGLCARGGIEVELSWKQGQLMIARLQFSQDAAVEVCYGTESMQIEGRAGKHYSLAFGVQG